MTTHNDYVDWVKRNRPDYIVLEQYTNSKTKILHQHIQSGRMWKCSPGLFKRGVSHPDISRRGVLHRTHNDYVDWVKRNRPDYIVLEQYVNAKTKIQHQHIPSQITWKCSPEKFMQGKSPTELTSCERFDGVKYQQFVEANKIPVIILGEYKRKERPIKHQCTITGETFFIAPNRVLKNPQFRYKIVIHNTHKYSEWLCKNYPDLIAVEPYISSHTKIHHVFVPTGNSWFVKPNNVLMGQRCPWERSRSYSRVAIQWLEQQCQINNIHIQHKLNGGEYFIPGIGRVDGFCKETNTVYEFHGNFWHGNPTMFAREDIHPIVGRTYGSLFDDTIDRELRIKQQGYNLCVMWESDFRNKKCQPN